MNKTLKGAGAAVAAGVLLLGGAGSLAYWSDAETITGTDIASGKLALTDPVCGSWLLNGGAYTAPVAGIGSLIVPSDTLTRTCTYTVDAAGQNLTADLVIETPTFTDSTGLTDELDATAAFTVTGLPAVSIDETNDGDVLEAVITVDFPFGIEDNDSQDLLAALNDITVTATQTDATP